MTEEIATVVSAGAGAATTGTIIYRHGEVLIEKISSAVGGYFQPNQIVRLAKANASKERIEAETKVATQLIKEKGKLAITELHQRAAERFIEEEAKKQLNMESIQNQAIPMLAESASPELINDDWLVNFFDKCRITSDDEMQKIWASMLAGEANNPGKFARKTVNLLADFDKSDAILFTKFCSFIGMVGSMVPLIYDITDDIYTNNGIAFNSLTHLDSLGLIHFEAVADFTRIKLPKEIKAFYYGQPTQFVLPLPVDNTIITGKALLTKAGHEFALICGSKPVDGFLNYLRVKWASLGYIGKDGDQIADELLAT